MTKTSIGCISHPNYCGEKEIVVCFHSASVGLLVSVQMRKRADVWAALRGCSKLQTLCFRDCGFDEEKLIEMLPTLSGLQSLRLEHIPDLADR